MTGNCVTVVVKYLSNSNNNINYVYELHSKQKNNDFDGLLTCGFVFILIGKCDSANHF